MSASIYPIRYLHFRCDGCGAEWTLLMEPPIRGIEDLKAFTDEGKMGPCPRGCGANKCSMKFRLNAEAASEFAPAAITPAKADPKP